MTYIISYAVVNLLEQYHFIMGPRCVFPFHINDYNILVFTIVRNSVYIILLTNLRAPFGQANTIGTCYKQISRMSRLMSDYSIHI